MFEWVKQHGKAPYRLDSRRSARARQARRQRGARLGVQLTQAFERTVRGIRAGARSPELERLSAQQREQERGLVEHFRGHRRKRAAFLTPETQRAPARPPKRLHEGDRGQDLEVAARGRERRIDPFRPSESGARRKPRGEQWRRRDQRRGAAQRRGEQHRHGRTAEPALGQRGRARINARS